MQAHLALKGKRLSLQTGFLIAVFLIQQNFSLIVHLYFQYLKHMTLSNFIHADGTFEKLLYLRTLLFILYGATDDCSVPLAFALLPGR